MHVRTYVDPVLMDSTCTKLYMGYEHNVNPTEKVCVCVPVCVRMCVWIRLITTTLWTHYFILAHTYCWLHHRFIHQVLSQAERNASLFLLVPPYLAQEHIFGVEKSTPLPTI